MSAPDDFAELFTCLADNIERVIRGKRAVVELALVCLLAEGHLLLEDVPGTGKTLLARSLAASIGGGAQRIQFTPDLLPSDVLGVSIYHPGSSTFAFHPGPVFSNVVHADEINRASPKTQSALLEVMEERRVTVDGAPHPVPRPFLVVATQNPSYMGGTYPLPEAQLDRFLMRLGMGYPDHTAEVSILADSGPADPLDRLAPVVTLDAVTALIGHAAGLHAAAAVHDYIVGIVSATRRSPWARLGASPRASVALLRAARVRAAAADRPFVTADDVRELCRPVLTHRIVLTPDALLQGRTAEELVDGVVAQLPVPTASGARA